MKINELRIWLSPRSPPRDCGLQLLHLLRHVPGERRRGIKVTNSSE